MDDPQLYRNNNEMQKLLAKRVIEKYADRLYLYENGTNTVCIDVGCGSGEVTMELLYPYLAAKNCSLIAIDRSQKMINHAKNLYKDSRIYKNTDFRVFDFTVSKIEELPKADLVTSFSALHWIKNQTAVFKNICDLLKPGGGALLLIGAKMQAYNGYYDLAETKKWGKYLKDVRNFVVYQECKHQKDVCGRALRQAKFSNYEIVDVQTHFDFDNRNHLKRKAFCYIS